MSKEIQGYGMTHDMLDAHASVHGDVPFVPRMSLIREMEEIEKEHGNQNPDAVLPRLRRWFFVKWGKFWGL